MGPRAGSGGETIIVLYRQPQPQWDVFHLVIE